MNKSKLKEDIIDFVENKETEEDFDWFWKTRFRDENEEENVIIPSSNIYFMDEGIYDKVAEIDFTKFSLTNVKQVMNEKNSNKEIRDIINTILEVVDRYDKEPWRLKKLRIAFFEMFENLGVSFYNPELYKKCQIRAQEKIDRAEEIAETHDSEVIAKTWDSVTYIANRTKAKSIKKEIEDKLDHRLTMKWFKRVVTFRNISRFKLSGETYTKRNTSTGEIQDRLKENLTKDLMNLDFHKARRRIANSKINNGLKKDYLKTVTKIHDEKGKNCRSIKDYM